jgi:peptide/nickel transport system ATP-binding protein
MSGSRLLSIEGVSKSFASGRQRIQAVHNVSLTIDRGQTFGLVGESGSGKSTLGRLAIGLIKPDQGAVKLEGVDLVGLSARQLKDLRRSLQIVFQDPAAALNQRASVAANIMEPLKVHRIGTRAERVQRAAALLERVGLGAQYGTAMPDELSGGQAQRVMIARALALGPKLLVCDEILSALDVSVQAQVLGLLEDLRQSDDLAYLFISHNLSAVTYLSHNIGVMYLGELVEWAPTETLMTNAVHPYTQALFQAILEVPPSKSERRPFALLSGEVPSAVNRPSGCPFHTRCPAVMDRCRTTPPPARAVSADHYVACHLLDEG